MYSFQCFKLYERNYEQLYAYGLIFTLTQFDIIEFEEQKRDISFTLKTCFTICSVCM